MSYITGVMLQSVTIKHFQIDSVLLGDTIILNYWAQSCILQISELSFILTLKIFETGLLIYIGKSIGNSKP